MVPIIPIIAIGVGTVILWIARRSIRKLFSKKKTLLTGPLASGKTTFLRHIAKDIILDDIPDGPSGAPKQYKVNNAMFDEVTDFSGAEVWLKTKFDEYIKEHDFILFFFDISEYLQDPMYKAHSNARIDMIHRNTNSSQKVLIVGTHIDRVSGNFKAEVENSFAGKSYQSVLNRIVYINTTEKECVLTILNELKK